MIMYHVSCEPLRIFWYDDTTCPTRVPRVLSTTGWKASNPAHSRQHAWHSRRAGCIVISENPQGLATHMVHLLCRVKCSIGCNRKKSLILNFQLIKCNNTYNIKLIWIFEDFVLSILFVFIFVFNLVHAAERFAEHYFEVLPLNKGI